MQYFRNYLPIIICMWINILDFCKKYSCCHKQKLDQTVMVSKKKGNILYSNETFNEENKILGRYSIYGSTNTQLLSDYDHNCTTDHI